VCGGDGLVVGVLGVMFVLAGCGIGSSSPRGALCGLPVQSRVAAGICVGGPTGRGGDGLGAVIEQTAGGRGVRPLVFRAGVFT
jgi:hypothetical protein